MSVIAIDRMKVRYRLPRTALPEQPRLQRIMADALDRVLEEAVARSGVGRSDYVCIREMKASATLRLREPDSALAARLGDAIALAIHETAHQRSSSVVRYGSRVQALIDLAVNALGGDFTRSWAWTQVGIWHADAPHGAGAAADLIVRALAAEAKYASAVVTYLARARTEAFTALISLVTPHAWNALAGAALAVMGVTDGGRRTDGAVHGPAADSIARRIVAQSAIARVLIGRLPPLQTDTRRALAAFVLLEVEPAAIRDGREPGHLAAIERALTHATTAPGIDRAAHESAEHADRAQADPASGRVDAGDPERDTRSIADAGVLLLDSSVTAAFPHSSSSPRAGHATAIDRLEGRDDFDESSDAPAYDPAARVPDVRRSAHTGRGGVLYLVNLIERIGLVEIIRRDDRWSDRGTRWVLHQLAMILGGIGPSDPAALAFAGLPPDAPPPSSLQAPLDDAEAAALEALRATIAGSLRDVLARPADAEATLMDEVCARHAQVVADPGWIEVRFPLEAVSIDVRRAGLDLDPDWVPWLGVVMRFVYA